jgi:uncharacterized lipoprotein YehR (DUF1307 family)
MSIFRPTYTRIDPKTGKKAKRRLSKWYVRYRDAAGLMRTIPGYTDKEATRALEVELKRKAARQQVGLDDPHEEHARKPLRLHLDDYERFLRGQGNTEGHVTLSLQRARSLVDGCHWI